MIKRVRGHIRIRVYYRFIRVRYGEDGRDVPLGPRALFVVEWRVVKSDQDQGLGQS